MNQALLSMLPECGLGDQPASLLFLVLGLLHQHGHHSSGTVSQDTFSPHRFFSQGTLSQERNQKSPPVQGAVDTGALGERITRADYL